MDWQLVTTFAATLLAVLNPLSGVPVYMASTAEDAPGVRRDVAGLLAGAVVVMLLAGLLAGQALLDFFGITLAAFRVGGGVLLMLTGLTMARHPLTVDADTAARHAKAAGVRDVVRARFGQLVVPIAVPLIVGPGSLATVILYASQADGLPTTIGLAGVVAAAGVVVFVSLSTAGLLRRVIGETGMAVSARLLGMLLVALAAQFVLTGLAEAFPVLAG